MVTGPASENPGSGQSPWGQSSLGGSRLCAYNQTRERFISTDVESADFSAASLHDRLPALTPGCRIAFWINPFRGIAATSVSVPIDLIYLDRNFVVLDTFESFPIFQVGDSSVPAASVLALPAETIGSTETRPGDRLVICPPEELRRRLFEAAEAKADPASGQAGLVGTGVAPRREEPAAAEQTSAAQGAARSETAQEELQTSGGAISPAAGTAQASGRIPWKKPTAKRSWLQRLISDEPLDPRNAPREALSWITAYFFTGGTPKAHGIRDISAGGVYIFTEERWYPGTVIRMTLTDRRRPSAERSFTVNAKVIRWGNDGVGLQFLLSEKKAPRRGKGAGDSDSVEDITKADVDQFLNAVRGGPG